MHPGQADITFIFAQGKGVGYLRGPQWVSNKELDCVFLGTRKVLGSSASLLTSLQKENTALGQGQDTPHCVRWKHVETDQDRKTGMEHRPEETFTLEPQIHRLPLFMGWKGFSWSLHDIAM